MFSQLRRNRLGIEVNLIFIVVIIIALAVFAGSLVLIRNFFAGAEKIKLSIDAQTEAQIKSMLLGGAKVALPINQITAHDGEFITFGVGILNVLTTAGPEDSFTITASPCTPVSYITLKNPVQTAMVKKNEQKIFLVGYQIGNNAPRGTYICNIKVTKSDNKDYAESVYKAYIKIE
jgi:hypothetical protein